MLKEREYAGITPVEELCHSYPHGPDSPTTIFLIPAKVNCSAIFCHPPPPQFPGL